MTQRILVTGLATLLVAGCAANAPSSEPAAPAAAPTEAAVAAPTSAQQPAPPPVDANNILAIAQGSADHSTLVQAILAADLATAVAASGPLTVFAPTNAAFEKLPAGTVEGLLAPDKKGDLANILKYHVAPSVYDATNLKDGQELGMANGGKVTVHLQDGQLSVNEAKVIQTIRASNGIIHVVDGVLLPGE
jgi:uncharacterized surface protein with fasciclin (FAS1) repeats